MIYKLGFYNLARGTWRESNPVCYIAMQDDIRVQFSLYLTTEKNYVIYYRAAKN